jgi:hypothetical protein
MDRTASDGPAGAALNAGQVGGFRAGGVYRGDVRTGTISCPRERSAAALGETLAVNAAFCGGVRTVVVDVACVPRRVPARMTLAGAHLRSASALAIAQAEARRQNARLAAEGCRVRTCARISCGRSKTASFCFAHAVYLAAQAVRGPLRRGESRLGAGARCGGAGACPRTRRSARGFRETRAGADGRVRHCWCRGGRSPRRTRGSRRRGPPLSAAIFTVRKFLCTRGGRDM